jgi:2-oxo-3-hexenedioate decarboxylase
LSIDASSLQKLARVLDAAARNATPVPMISLSHDGLTEADGYKIQQGSMRRRKARGEKVIGMKMGLTSRAKMEQVGVHAPIYGTLTDAMLVEDGGVVYMNAHCHPRVEPEVCFRLSAPLSGEVSKEEALAACDGVCAALEVIDSRYENFKFTLADVVADNASSTKFVLGAWHEAGTDVADLAMSMQAGDELREGSSKAILDHPLLSLCELAARVPLQAGWVVMCGASTAAVHLAAGMDVRLTVETLGEVGFTVEQGA